MAWKSSKDNFSRAIPSLSQPMLTMHGVVHTKKMLVTATRVDAGSVVVVDYIYIAQQSVSVMNGLRNLIER